MTYNLFPSMRAIKCYEKMTHNSFLDLERNQEDIVKFLYCCLIAHKENNFKYSFEEACNNFFPRHINDLLTEFAFEMNVINQFKEAESTADDSSIDLTQNSSPKEKENMFLSSLIPILVSDCGLDINYVLDDMPYNDISMYINYNIEKKREAMETQRFWTFLEVMPHISSKAKIKKPEDLIEFTWEKDERVEEAKKKMEIDRERLIELGFIKEDSSLNITEEE